MERVRTESDLIWTSSLLDLYMPLLGPCRAFVMTFKEVSNTSAMQEYGILPHSRPYYCLLFSLYHMFIIFVISY